MDVIVAIDIGTTATKCSLVVRDGRILAQGSAGYPLTQHGNAHEQRPDDWWQATQQALHQAVEAAPTLRPVALVLSGQMQDAILVGEAGALPPTLLYSDTRAQNEARAVEQQIGAARLQQLTGNVQDASGLLAKLLWLRANAPDSYARAHTLFVGAHDYVTWRLCGARAADTTTAATTGLLDLHTRRWAVELLAELELRADWLPPLVPAAQVVGALGAEAARACGLPEGLPVVHGAGDVATATLGAGAGEPGSYSLYLGTSGWLATSSDAAPLDPLSGIFNLCHPQPGRLILVGPMLTAGGNFAWLREQFGGLEATVAGLDDTAAYTRLEELAAQAAPGSDGVLFLPYLAGERSPFREPHARGRAFGAWWCRAVLEGVAFAMRSIREAMPPANGSPQTISLAGGGARSRLWAQIFADVFGCELRILAEPQNVGARGAALLAAQALGWQQGYVPPPGYLPVAETLYPSAAAATYDTQFARFQALVAALRPFWSQLGNAASDV
jgi:xylulokinase